MRLSKATCHITFSSQEGISPVHSEFSSASLSGTDIALPNSKAQPAGFRATAQLTHLVLSGVSIRRKRHESVIESGLKPPPGYEPEHAGYLKTISCSHAARVGNLIQL